MVSIVMKYYLGIRSLVIIPVSIITWGNYRVIGLFRPAYSVNGGGQTNIRSPVIVINNLFIF